MMCQRSLDDTNSQRTNNILAMTREAISTNVTLWLALCSSVWINCIEAAVSVRNADATTFGNVNEQEVVNATLFGASDGDASDTYVLSFQEDDEEQLILCPLCLDPSHEPLDKVARFTAGKTTVTCAYAFSKSIDLRLPKSNCTDFQEWGGSLCRCGPVAVGNNSGGGTTTRPAECRLCQNGAPLPNPAWAGLPQITCAELQAQAMRDDPFMCPIYQATIGTYCGCNSTMEESDMSTNNTTPSVCRICGDKLLPNHLQSVGMHVSQTCGELEFHANQPDGRHDCQLFQKLYAQDCCGSDDNDDDEDGLDPSILHASGGSRTIIAYRTASFLTAMMHVVAGGVGEIG